MMVGPRMKKKESMVMVSLRPYWSMKAPPKKVPKTAPNLAEETIAWMEVEEMWKSDSMFRRAPPIKPRS